MALIWHGGNRWEGAPEIRPAKGNRAEWGPGIYGSSSYFRAKEYAKGGKVTTLITLDPGYWLNDVALSLDEVESFVARNAPKAKALDIMQVLNSRADRIATQGGNDKLTRIGSGSDFVPATNLLNMWVNTGLSSGVKGPNLAAFFAERGIGAYSDYVGARVGEKEYWTVIFDPDRIRGHEVIAAKDVPETLWSLGNPRIQEAPAAHNYRETQA